MVILVTVAVGYPAASDQTGQSIALLTAGLIGVAVGLGMLTVWYWRHTDPKRSASERSRMAPTEVESADERSPAPATEAVPRGNPASVVGPAPVTNPLWEILAEPLVDAELVVDAGSVVDTELVVEGGSVVDTELVVDAGSTVDTGPVVVEDDQLGLDDDQWALLTQAVFDSYLANDGD